MIITKVHSSDSFQDDLGPVASEGEVLHQGVRPSRRISQDPMLNLLSNVSNDPVKYVEQQLLANQMAASQAMGQLPPGRKGRSSIPRPQQQQQTQQQTQQQQQQGGVKVVSSAPSKSTVTFEDSLNTAKEKDAEPKQSVDDFSIGK